MRKLVLSEFLSFDGVAETPTDFILDFDDEVMDEFGERTLSTQDTVVLGRRTYDEWAGFWPESDIEPFASFINAVPKFVVTSTPLDQSWANSTVAQVALHEFITSLKNQPGGDIGVTGSITLSQALLAQGLVDELRLVIAPAIMVKGRKLFEGTAPSRFEVTRNVTSRTGYLLVELRLVEGSYQSQLS
jgi:dihydrofolate reductase